MAVTQLEEQILEFTIEAKDVFGDDTTRSLADLERLVRLGLADHARVKSQGGLVQSITIAKMQEFDELPEECPAPGKNIFIIYESGRIDRFKVIQDDKLCCFLRRNPSRSNLATINVYYEPREIGDCLAWDCAKADARHSNKFALRCNEKIARILISGRYS